MFGRSGKGYNPETDIPSLKGKVILVTGGNTGLGKETIRQLIKHHPKEVFLAARTPSKGEAAVAELKKETPDAVITYLKMDLTSFESIKQAADEFKFKSDRLDILLNNAGIMATPYSLTKENYEIQFGTCHMGHALLTRLLLPTLLHTAEESGSDVRVVNLSSEGHQLARFPKGILFDQAKAETYGTWSRYGSAKLANILHVRALQKHYPQLTATSLHPGVINTDLFNSFANSNRVVKWIMSHFFGLFAQTVPQGARNQLWCCTAPKAKVRESFYFTPVGSANGGSGYAKNDKLADELWSWTEDEITKKGY